MSTRTPWFFHPIFVFVASILALALSLALYIYWYVNASVGLHHLAVRYHIDPNQFLEARTWVVILVLSLLVAVILAGTLIIFIYSQKMVRLNRLQHEFINNFTHELKTPVTSLKLYLETFQQHDLPREEMLKYIEYMLQDTHRLSEQINGILNLAKIESKTYGGEFVPTDLVKLTESFVQQNRHLFGKSRIEIHNPADHPLVYPINQPLFEMLLMNLLNNGILYNDSEIPHIDINFEADTSNLQLRFEDNGIGILPAEKRKIFRKFYRGDMARVNVSRGTGLGLYLVRQVVRMHKGRIRADNREGGKGTVFTVTFPLRKESGKARRNGEQDPTGKGNGRFGKEAHPDYRG